MWQTIVNITLRAVLAVVTPTEVMFKSSTCIIVVNTDTMYSMSICSTQCTYYSLNWRYNFVTLPVSPVNPRPLLHAHNILPKHNSSAHKQRNSNTLR